MEDDIVKVGKYIIIQRQKYKKIHKFNNPDGNISLGKDTVQLTGIEGCKFFSAFKLEAKGSKKQKIFGLEPVTGAVNLKSQIDIKQSGSDNRSIVDDGKSQKLTATEIENLKNDNISTSELVETLISNSNTFHQKTEFSQEKYLKKKEKKYFEYIQVIKPTIRLIAEILYKLDPSKVLNVRIDSLSQIISYSNVNAFGNHLLYDSGSNGLLSAALLNAIGSNTEGKLLHMHPGNVSQKQALLAMNYPQEQLDRCISVNIYSALRQYYQGKDTNDKIPADNKDEQNTEVSNESRKRTHSDNESEVPEKTFRSENSEPKKPKWHFDNIKAGEILANKLDSLIIVCKEHPLNIFDELHKFIKPGRPFVVFYNVSEPLQDMFLTLKSRSNVSALKLFSNWMRDYQVLPERTHPEMVVNQNGGFLLTGYILQ